MGVAGQVTTEGIAPHGREPTSEERERVEATIAKLRAAKERKLRGEDATESTPSPPDPDLAPVPRPSALKAFVRGDAPPPGPAAPVAAQAQPGPCEDYSAGNCPDCGKPYGKIRRCFACKPTTPKATVTPRPAAPAPVAADRPDDLLRELDAMRAVVAALDGLDPAAAARVLGWVSGRVRGESR
jgi:hypothetical protein